MFHHSKYHRLVLFLSITVVSTIQSNADVVITTVAVGNAGNPNDISGFGSVDYSYRIGATEVTNGQYVEFLNSVDPTGSNSLRLFSSRMNNNVSGGIQFNSSAGSGLRYQIKSGRANNPVNYVTGTDAMRFTNWLHNGQGTGSTEFGAYLLDITNGGPTNTLLATRTADARWALTSENEWYKAAYHENDGVTNNYSRYPTQSNSQPYSIQAPGSGAPDPTNAANIYLNDNSSNGFNNGFATTGQTSFPSGNGLVDVGSYAQTTSAYGLFDTAGSVHEWNESVIGNNRGFRGGSFWSGSFGIDLDDSQERFSGLSNGFEERDIGFRVTQLVTAVPEPASIIPLFICGTIMGLRRRNRAKQLAIDSCLS